jgi:Smr domain
MKFEIGDKVTVLHSNEEAEVVEMINDKMVMVEVRGVKFPAYIDQLDFPYFKRFTEKKTGPQKKAKTFIDQIPVDKTAKRDNPKDGCWIRIIPVSDSDEFGDEVVESLKIYLVNHTEKGMHFQFKLSYSGDLDFEVSGELPAGKDFYLLDMPFENLNDAPVMETDFRLVLPEKSKAPHYETSLKFRAKPVFSRIDDMRKKGDSGFAYKLFDRYPDKVFEEDKQEFVAPGQKDNKLYDAKRARQHLEPAKYEVDLHIEKLTSEWQHLSNLEILTMQLNTFEKYLELAIAHHQHNLIVIHGVGKGKLKEEIHEILNAKREVRSYINQYDPRYGYGATEIFL